MLQRPHGKWTPVLLYQHPHTQDVEPRLTQQAVPNAPLSAKHASVAKKLVILLYMAGQSRPPKHNSCLTPTQAPVTTPNLRLST